MEGWAVNYGFRSDKKLISKKHSQCLPEEQLDDGREESERDMSGVMHKTRGDRGRTELNHRGERETDRERDRDRERETDRERDRDRDRERETEREIEIERDRERESETERQRDRELDHRR
jgi:zinc finger CCCH domain-containing protein 13